MDYRELFLFLYSYMTAEGGFQYVILGLIRDCCRGNVNRNIINCMTIEMKNILGLVAAAGTKAVAVCLLVMMVMSGCVKEDESGADLRVGDELPEFEVMMSDGSVVGDDDLRGSVSVVMFFHTGCPDCQKALPVIQRIYDEYAPKNVKIAVISREENKNVIEAYWIKNGLKMPFSAQTDRSVYSKFAKTLIPRIYVNDKEGIIRYIYTDDPVPTYDDLKSAIESL